MDTCRTPQLRTSDRTGDEQIFFGYQCKISTLIYREAQESIYQKVKKKISSIRYGSRQTFGIQYSFRGASKLHENLFTFCPFYQRAHLSPTSKVSNSSKEKTGNLKLATFNLQPLCPSRTPPPLLRKIRQ